MNESKLIKHLPTIGRIFTPAAMLVVMSSIMAGPLRVGTLIEIGLGGSRLAVPPKGAVKRPPPLSSKMPMQSCAAAIGGNAPRRPMWLD